MKRVSRSCILIAAVTLSHLFAACTLGGESYPVPVADSGAAVTATAPEPAAVVPYYGVVDRRDCETLGGWVMNSTDLQEDIRVELYIDDTLVEAMPAQNLRQDLVNKMGTGRYGFSFTIPSAYKDGRPHATSVKVAGSDYTVPFYEGVFSTFECGP